MQIMRAQGCSLTLVDTKVLMVDASNDPKSEKSNEVNSSIVDSRRKNIA